MKKKLLEVLVKAIVYAVTTAATVFGFNSL